MAKARKAQKIRSIPQKHLHSRISYLYQAATLFSQPETTFPGTAPAVQSPPRLQAIAATSASLAPNSQTPTLAANLHPQSDPIRSPRNIPLARLYASHLCDISLKAQIHLSTTIKRSLCKRCYTLLLPTVTSTTRVENLSKGGKKPWADVLVLRCGGCGAEKRVPVGGKRQLRRGERRMGVEEQNRARGNGDLDGSMETSGTVGEVGE